MKTSWKGWQTCNRFLINWTSAKIITFRAKSLKTCKGGINLPSGLTFRSSNHNFPSSKWNLPPPNSSKMFCKNNLNHWRTHLRSSNRNSLLQSASSCWVRRKRKTERFEYIICKEQRKSPKKMQETKHQTYRKNNYCLQKSISFQHLPITKFKIRQWVQTL